MARPLPAVPVEGAERALLFPHRAARAVARESQLAAARVRSWLQREPAQQEPWPAVRAVAEVPRAVEAPVWVVEALAPARVEELRVPAQSRAQVAAVVAPRAWAEVAESAREPAAVAREPLDAVPVCRAWA